MVTDVDRLRLIYELDDKAARAGFDRVKQAADEANKALIEGAKKAEREAAEAARKAARQQELLQKEAAAIKAAEIKKAAAAEAAETKRAATEAAIAARKKAAAEAASAREAADARKRAMRDAAAAEKKAAAERAAAVSAAAKQQANAEKRAAAEAAAAVKAAAKQKADAERKAAAERAAAADAAARAEREAARLADQAAFAAASAKQRKSQQIGGAAVQVGDLAVQMGMGTSFMRAAGQQLPQIAGYFGTAGMMAGALLAIMFPLADSMLRMAGNGKSLADQMKDLTASTDAMVDAAENANRPIYELRDAFGSLADEMARADQAQAMFARIRAEADLVGAARSIGKQFGSLAPATAPTQWDGRVNPDRARLAAQEQVNAMRALKKETGATDEQMQRLLQAFRRMETTNGPQAAAKDAANLQSVLAEIADNAGVTEAQMANLSRIAGDAGAVRAQAERQVAAAMSESQRIIERYAGTTRELEELARDRGVAEAALTKARAEGNAALIKQLQEVMANLDEQIAKTKELGRESDVAFRRMSAAYQQAGASRLAAVSSQGDAASLIRGFEGYRETPYWDVNHYRVGYGSDTVTLADGSVREVVQGMKVSYEDANRDLERRVNEFQQGIIGVIGSERWDTFSDPQKAALTSVAYNYGGLPDRIMGAVRGGSVEDIANAIARLAGDNAGVNRDRRLKEASAFGGGDLARAEMAVADKAASDRQRALEKETQERNRQLEQVRQYGEQLASQLVTEQQRAKLEAERAAATARINASDMSGAGKAAAIAEVNGEMQRQLTIMALMEDAKRRQVDLDAKLADGSMTYREAIAALGEQAKAKVVVDQQVEAQAQRSADAQAFYAKQQQDLEDGLVDSIVTARSFDDVLQGLGKTFMQLAAELAKQSLMAAFFGKGPLAGGFGIAEGGGLLSSLFGGFRAAGGPVQPGKAYVVGENRPELFVPHVPGTILPSVPAQSGSTVTFAPTIHANGAVSQADLDMAKRQMAQFMDEQFVPALRKHMPNFNARYA